ncbi:putative glycosyltransferase STELLO1 [Porphyridium purpureum]|uniref:Putative glycosyltransferase STELLO1 n=1 Tax=Porphyridium purpureum TaxID=35688 RepID=A0A5J4YL01_PORPP|nr:putative glycosyltransferase STELLO1 [Porphyridium purpureum]|eukprot:POR3906..scf249_10
MTGQGSVAGGTSGYAQRVSAFSVGFLSTLLAIFALHTVRDAPTAPGHVSSVFVERLSASNHVQGASFQAARVRTFTHWDALDAIRPRRRTPSASREIEPACSRWAVITSIFKPTVLVYQLAALSVSDGWCTVVVGDKKSPRSYLPHDFDGRVVYLSPDDQLALPFRSVASTPWNHFGRKNLGFLYAVWRGAKVIYDTDDDNRLRTRDECWEKQCFRFLNATALLSAQRKMNRLHQLKPPGGGTAKVTNPYLYFGAKTVPELDGLPASRAHRDALMRLAANALDPDPDSADFIWPRGYPLTEILNDEARTRPRDRKTERTRIRLRDVAVFQSLADHDPDVDAVYRLTRARPVEFRGNRTVTVIPAGVMSPYNAQATLFRHSAFWSLYLPTTVPGRVSDIWRSYFGQRLLWDTGMYVAFTKPWVVQYRNEHDFMKDLEAERLLYTHADALVNALNDWTCLLDRLSSCLDLLYISMYELGMIELGDVMQNHKFLTDLAEVGYEFPRLTAQARGAGTRKR